MTDRILPGPSLNPTAAPVDRYVRPEQQFASEGGLSAVARTLQRVNPSLQKFISNRYEQQAARDAAEGARAELYVDPEQGLEANRQGWGKLIDSVRSDDAKNGTSNADQLAGASPHFRRGLVAARANRIGLGLDNYIQKAWTDNEGGIQGQDDPTAVNQWLQETANAYGDKMGVMDIDPLIAADTYTPRVASTQDAMFNKHMSYRAAKRAAAYKAEVKAQAAALAARTENALAGATTSADFQSILDKAIADGMDKKTANKMIVEGISLTAQELGNASLFDVLDDISTGNGPLGNVSWAREERLKVGEKIEDNAWETETRAHTMEERERTEAGRNVTIAGFSSIFKDPWSDQSELTGLAIATGNPNVALQMKNLQRQLRADQFTVPANHEAVIDMRNEIYRGDSDDADIARRIVEGTGSLWPHSVGTSLFDDLEKGSTQKDMVRDADVRREIDRVRSIVNERQTVTDILGNKISSGLEGSRDVENEIVDGVLIYLEENPEASVNKVRRETRRLADEMLKSERYAQRTDDYVETIVAPANAEIAETIQALSDEVIAPMAAASGMTVEEYREAIKASGN